MKIEEKVRGMGKNAKKVTASIKGSRKQQHGGGPERK